MLAALLVLKFGIVFAASRVFGSPPRARRCAPGLWLCAGGEFGFVLLSQILELG
jgi:CPA2 family monovalent cation:H+ antiporter-2